MAAFNESVTNLQEFNALVREAVSRLTEQTRSLEGEAGTLQQLDTGTAAGLDELNAAIGQLETAFEGHAAQAGEEVQQLTAAAAKGSDARLPQAQQDIDERASAVEQALERDGAALEGAWSDLQASGFEPADSVLTSLATEAESLQHGAEQAFDDADAQLDAAQGDATAAESAVEGAASGFASETDGQQGAAEEVATVAAMLDQAAGELSSTVEAMVAELEQAYETLGQETGQATDEMVTEVSGLIETAGTSLDDDSRQVEQAVAEVGDGASAQLVGALSQAEALVCAGETITEPCTTLVPELAKCRDIAGEIERLLQAMA
jgi:uncharacterized protein YukE